MSTFTKGIAANGQLNVFIEDTEQTVLCKPLLVYKAFQNSGSSSWYSQTVYKDYLLSSEAFLLP